MAKQARDLLQVIFLPDGFRLEPEGELAPDSWESEYYQAYMQSADAAFYHGGFKEPPADAAPALRFVQGLAARFIDRVAQSYEIGFTRDAADLPLYAYEVEAILKGLPFALGEEFVDADWLHGQWRRLAAQCSQELKAFSGSVAEYLISHNDRINVMGRIYFHLVENKDDGEYPFAFLATYCKGDEATGHATHLPLKHALLEYQGKDDMLIKLLATVTRTAQQSAFISDLLESGEIFSPLKLDRREAWLFLREAELYQSCGVMCRIPDWWRRRGASVQLQMRVGEKAPSQLGAEQLLSFEPVFTLEDEALSAEEIERLLAATEGLALIRGRWVEVDHEKLRATLTAFQQAQALYGDEGVSFAEAMRWQLGSGAAGLGKLGAGVQVSNGEWLRRILQAMEQPAQLKDVALGSGLRAQLRPYQQQGLNWLAYMRDLGLGACLADDMGLGKTVQIIALLEKLRQEGGGSSLLIIPASLINNWQSELERFAPQVSCRVLHAQYDGTDFDLAEGVDLYITTYGMAQRLETLRAVQWETVILDEAQAIKNPGTKQTKAVKQLKSGARIALTGTPIENGLSDLWSLFDFLNAGMLGTAKEFTGYTSRLLREEGGYSRLRMTVSPFILRRLKTDKSIISDLPDKIEMKAYATLSRKQIVLYQKVVNDLERGLRDAEGIERKGLVLASIMRLKQICNHPDHYLGQSGYAEKDSGKLERLREICETIYEKRERALVFTQFKEICEPLADFLGVIFKRSGLIIHGGVSVKKRGALVEQFNGAAYTPFMVLSLKAGGTGLNLTGANHVIHFDRWWNPAVEDQATDRAFRIGQTKNVLVHKLILSGTIEEKIDAMIESKRGLARDIIAASGENWITELDDDELMKLLKLEL